MKRIEQLPTEEECEQVGKMISETLEKMQ